MVSWRRLQLKVWEDTFWDPSQHRGASGNGIGAVINRGPASVGLVVYARAELRFAGLLVSGSQHRSGGVDHRGVANRFALLILDSLHSLQLGHAVRVLGGTCDQGLDIVLDGRLVERVDLVNNQDTR